MSISFTIFDIPLKPIISKNYRKATNTSTVPFESIRRSRVTDPCAGTKFESCHGSWGQFVELIFHVTDHLNCLEIVEK